MHTYMHAYMHIYNIQTYTKSYHVLTLFPVMQPLCVGSSIWGQAGWYAFHGAIGPVSLWHTVHTAAQVMESYNGKSCTEG